MIQTYHYWPFSCFPATESSDGFLQTTSQINVDRSEVLINSPEMNNRNGKTCRYTRALETYLCSTEKMSSINWNHLSVLPLSILWQWRKNRSAGRLWVTRNTCLLWVCSSTVSSACNFPSKCAKARVSQTVRVCVTVALLSSRLYEIRVAEGLTYVLSLTQTH